MGGGRVGGGGGRVWGGGVRVDVKNVFFIGGGGSGQGGVRGSGWMGTEN